jgi:hypothetical protein
MIKEGWCSEPHLTRAKVEMKKCRYPDQISNETTRSPTPIHLCALYDHIRLVCAVEWH